MLFFFVRRETTRQRAVWNTLRLLNNWPESEKVQNLNNIQKLESLNQLKIQIVKFSLECVIVCNCVQCKSNFVAMSYIF